MTCKELHDIERSTREFELETNAMRGLLYPHPSLNCAVNSTDAINETTLVSINRRRRLFMDARYSGRSQARLAATGDVADNVGYMVEFDFGFPVGQVSWTSGWRIGIPRRVKIGQFRHPIGFDGLTRSKIDSANDAVQHCSQPEFFIAETGGAAFVSAGVPSAVPPFVDRLLSSEGRTSFGTTFATLVNRIVEELVVAGFLSLIRKDAPLYDPEQPRYSVNDLMKEGAAEAIASIISDNELHHENIVPSLFERRDASAVARTAIETGVSKRSQVPGLAAETLQ